MLSLNDLAGHIYFLCQLYNLLQLELYQDQETQAVILDHNHRIDCQLKESMHTKNDDTGGKHTHTGGAMDGGNHASKGGGDDHAQLRAHGYELKPGVDVDASSNDWAPLFKVPAIFLYLFAVLTVDPRGRIIFSLYINPWTRTRIHREESAGGFAQAQDTQTS